MTEHVKVSRYRCGSKSFTKEEFDLAQRMRAAAPEMYQMLKHLEWGTYPSGNECPNCHGDGYEGRHADDCALDALLKKVRGK